MEYQQLELPFVEPDFDDYEEQQSKFLDEPAFSWRDRAEELVDELETARETIVTAYNILDHVLNRETPDDYPIKLIRAVEKARKVLKDGV